MNELENRIKNILDKVPLRISMSKPVNKSRELLQKTVITKYNDKYKVEEFTRKQAFHKNLEFIELEDYINENMGKNFLQLTAFTSEKEYSLAITKKGKLLFNMKSSEIKINMDKSHNREKNYILKENEIIQPLIDMGIFTKDGKIVKAMNSKYRQINRFIEIIDDVISKKSFKTLNVIDFGCGKGYLTFLLYYYLKEIKSINPNIVGIDLKDDVIENCNIAAKKYGYSGATFLAEDIFKYNTTTPPDMVLSLHACDVATDYVLYNAIRWNSKMIFSMPCCQHEINAQIKSDTFSILTKYGVLKENISAILTDCIRCNVLTYFGYKVDVIDVVSPIDTPKNTLIRAVKANLSDATRQKAIKEVFELINEFNLSPTLISLLKIEQ